MTEAATFEGWAVLELMGHRRLAGRLSEATIGGGSFVRIDVPGDDGDVATQFYSPASVYCITPTTEENARAVALRNRPTPITRFELAPTRPAEAELVDVDDEDEPW